MKFASTAAETKKKWKINWANEWRNSEKSQKKKKTKHQQQLAMSATLDTNPAFLCSVFYFAILNSLVYLIIWYIFDWFTLCDCFHFSKFTCENGNFVSEIISLCAEGALILSIQTTNSVFTQTRSNQLNAHTKNVHLKNGKK